MIDLKKAEDIVRALRCTSIPGMGCDGQACAYCTVEELDEVKRQVYGTDVWTSCNLDVICIDAADMISALLAENDRLSDTIMKLRIMMRGDCGVCLHRHGGIGKEPCASCIDTDERGAWQLEGDEEHGRLNPEFKRKYMSRSLSDYDSLPSGLLTGGFEAKDRPTINKNIGLTADTCAQCGKRFEHTLEHAYRRRTDGRQKLFCSYSCMRAFDRRTENKAQKTAGVRGRPRMSAQEKIAYAKAQIERNEAELAACTDRDEMVRIRKRIAYHRKALENIQE